MSPRPSEVLIWIDDDGAAHELTVSEKAYVDTEFSPFDGARPYIKSRYDEKNGWGRLRGYLDRTLLPTEMIIAPAPPEPSPSPRTPESVAASILELIRREGRGGPRG